MIGDSEILLLTVFVRRTASDFAKPWTVHTDIEEARRSRDACIRDGSEAWIYHHDYPVRFKK